MSEPGIGSIEELLLFYLSFGFIVFMLWAALNADLCDDVTGVELQRRIAARHRIGRALAPLGVVHIGFAAVAHDLARFRHDDWPPADASRRRRATAEAVAGAVAGAVALAFAVAMLA